MIPYRVSISRKTGEKAVLSSATLILHTIQANEGEVTLYRPEASLSSFR